MLKLSGILKNIIQTPSSTNKATGEVYPAKNQVQVEGEKIDKHGNKKFELVTITYHGDIEQVKKTARTAY